MSRTSSDLPRPLRFAGVGGTPISAPSLVSSFLVLLGYCVVATGDEVEMGCKTLKHPLVASSIFADRMGHAIDQVCFSTKLNPGT